MAQFTVGSWVVASFRCGLLLLFTALAVAQAPAARPFDIQPQPLATALKAFGQQSGREVLFAPKIVADKRSPGVHGTMDAQAALAIVLSDSGLGFKITPGGAILVGDPTSLSKEKPESAAAGVDPPTSGLSPQPVEQTLPANSDAISEIIVTANRQEQNLQKVSAAVTVVDGSAITSEGLANIQQIFASLPSVQTTGQPGGSSIDIRGLGGDLPAGSTQGSVALVFDGVYNINSQGTTVGFFDVNRIEVLPGPQSTRYGPNADGGIVQVITNDPVLQHFSGAASLTGGNYDMVRGEAAVNLPIGDTLAIRLAAAALNRDSYFDPPEGGNKAQSVRAKVLWAPVDDFRLKVSYQMDHIGGAGNGSNAFPVFTNKVPVYPGGSINNLDDPWSQSPSDPVNASTTDIYQHTFTDNLSYDFGHNVAVDWMSSYTKMSGGETACIYLPPWSTGQNIGYGPVFCGASLNEFAPFHQFTTELRLHNDPGSPILWNLGYYHWNYLEQYSLVNAGPVSAPPVKTTTETNAIYGEITYPVADSLRVIAGARESFDHRTFNFDNAGTITPVFGIDFSHFDFRAGLEYDLAAKSMLYLTAASGYRPGGLSAFNPVTNAPDSFKSEVTTSFEVGSKNRFFADRLQVNADVFYYRQSNYQNLDRYSGFIPPEGGAPCANGDTRAGCQNPTFGVQAHSLGFETQLRALPTPDDMISLTTTVLHARFNENQGACATRDAPATPGCWDGYNSQSPNDPGTPFFFNLAGAVQPHSPDFSGTIAYTHTLLRLDAGTVTIGGSAFYSTGYWVNPVQDATLYGWQSSYWLGNLNANFTSSGDRWSINTFVRNVGDYAVKESVLPAQSIGDPRAYGATVSLKW